jgi:AraC-like DNA-binding protein
MEKSEHNRSRARHKSDRSSQARFETLVKRAICGLLAEPEPNPTIVAVAVRLDLNVRTLQRRLESVGMPFRELLSDCRQELACFELAGSDQLVCELSNRLGYSDPAHFARAFRRWTGYSPIEYRQHNAKRW